MTAMCDDFGVLYYVDDNPHFRKMAAVSIESVRHHHPDWPIRVTRCPALTTSMLRRLYRLVSFWKWAERHRRANQDWRVVFTKAYSWLESPFRHTLYVDVDTVLMRPLDGILSDVKGCDVAATSLAPKAYAPIAAWQPEHIPMLMAGVVYFGPGFVERYRGYVDRLSRQAGHGFSCDQYMFSTTCACEKASLDIRLVPELQIDNINLERHIGHGDWLRDGARIDLQTPELKRFAFFHYNGPYKFDYLSEIAAHWGYTGDSIDLSDFEMADHPVSASVPRIW